MNGVAGVKVGECVLQWAANYVLRWWDITDVTGLGLLRSCSMALREWSWPRLPSNGYYQEVLCSSLLLSLLCHSTGGKWAEDTRFQKAQVANKGFRTTCSELWTSFTRVLFHQTLAKKEVKWGTRSAVTARLRLACAPNASTQPDSGRRLLSTDACHTRRSRRRRLQTRSKVARKEGEEWLPERGRFCGSLRFLPC